jgi:hypothetical protein
MASLKPWRVRVMRAVELWVDVRAESPAQAEALARNLPQVLSVFGQSAVRADKLAGDRAVGVEEG